MGVNRNGTATKYMIYHNGKKLNKGYHNGTKEIWSAGSTVTYYVDTGVTYTEEKDYGASCLAPSTFTPEKSGYSFVGWKTDTGADGNIITSKTMESDPITLYAVFSYISTETFIDYDGSKNNHYYSYATNYYNNGNIKHGVATAPNGAKWSGMAFQGWSYPNSGERDVNVVAGQSWDSWADCTRYAIYAKTVYLYYNGNGATNGSVATQSGTTWCNVGGGWTYAQFYLSANGFSRTGHTFSGWDAGSVGTLVTVTGDSMTVSAQWTAINYWLDINGLENFGIVDVYINGSLVASGVNDYYTQHPYGTTYEFKNFRSTTGYSYVSANGSLKGTITGDTTISTTWKQTTLLSGMTAYGSYTTGSSGVWTHPDSAGGFTSKILTDNYVLCHTGNRTWFNEWDSNYKENYIQWTVDVTNLSSITFKGTYYDDYGCEFHSGTLCVNINGTDTGLASASGGGGSGTNTETVNNTVNVSGLSGNVTIKLYLYSYDEQGAYTCGLQANGASITAA